jgi:hypothetical protein
MEQYKITGTQMYRGKELIIEGILKVSLPGFLTGEIYGIKNSVKSLFGNNTEDKIALKTIGSINNCEASTLKDKENYDTTAISLMVEPLHDENIWYSPIHFSLKKPKSEQDTGILIEDKLVKSIPGTKFIAGEYVGTWYQDILTYNGPGSRAKAKPISGVGGNGLAKLVLTKIE